MRRVVPPASRRQESCRRDAGGTAVKPRGMVIIFVLLVIIALGALCTMATMLMRSSSQFVDLHDQAAQAQFDADGALEEIIAALNTKGASFLSEKHDAYSIERKSSSDTALALRVRVEKRTLDVQLAKNGARWNLSSYRIAE